MSTVTRPHGPLPARVYWTRRLLVLGAAFLLVFGLARILGSGSDGQSDPGATATQAGADPTPSATRTSREAGPTMATGKKKQKAKPTRKPRAVLAEPDGPCAVEDLVVAPVIDRARADDAIRIRFEVTGSEPACTWQVSPDAIVVKINSGKDLIWTSQHCPRVLPTKDLVVRAEKPVRVAMTWNGRRSDEDCSRMTEWAVPGWYHVVSAALGGEPTDRQFELRRVPRETVTKTAKPRPKKQNRNAESRPTEEPRDGERDGAQEPNG